MVSAQVVNRSWENKEYKQLVATVSNGTQTFRFIADDKKGEGLPQVVPFTRIRVDVEYAATEKGQVTVRGKVSADQ